MQLYNFFRNHTGVIDNLFKIDGFAEKSVDKDKLESFDRDSAVGLNNYLHFHQFSYFKWPHWICNKINKLLYDGSFAPSLSNNGSRDWICFTNLFSKDLIFIDPSGMISPSYALWSMEIWISTNAGILRPQERVENVFRKRDCATSMITAAWKEKDFELRQNIYGVKTLINEAVIELECRILKKLSSPMLMIVVRPYNNLTLGGIDLIEYKKDARILKINNHHRLAFDTAPEFYLAGNGESGDINVSDKEKELSKISCRYGMATMAFAYRLRMGMQRFNIRVSLSNNHDIGTAKIKFQEAKDEFLKNSELKLADGFNFAFPDPDFRKWMQASKISLLNNIHNDPKNTVEKSPAQQMKGLYFFTKACNRMGYVSDSGKIINSSLQNFKLTEKDNFGKIISCAYLLSSATDYFLHSRDLEFLKNHYQVMQLIAANLLKYSTRVKNFNYELFDKKNSIDYYLLKKSHIYDVLLIYHSLSQFSYLARCSGLFGDEIKFNKEALRLGKIITKQLNSQFSTADTIDRGSETGDICRDDYFGYSIYGGYPFGLDIIKTDHLKTIVSLIDSHYKGFPIYINSLGGIDTILSLTMAVNLLICRDERCYDILSRFMELAGERYTLPEVLNCKTGCGILGEPDSHIAMSAFFILLRNIFFMDYENRLDIMPLLRTQWLQGGSEIAIQNAPSRFGFINFKVMSFDNEVQFRFNDLPKFIPPEIMINLPYKMKIKESDDFIIKKEYENAVIINGWPSLIRFLK